MNTRKKHWAYYVRRIAFSIFQILALAKRGQHWVHMSKELARRGRDVWFSLLSLYYSLLGAVTSTSSSRVSSTA
jgi:hypothetical protein